MSGAPPKRSVSMLLWMAISISVPMSAELSRKTSRAFDAYLRAFEKQLSTRSHFLMADGTPGAREELRENRTIIRHVRPEKQPPDGMIHHWRGTIFVPGAPLGSSLIRLQDYDESAAHFGPEVISSRLLRRDGDDFQIRQRWKKTKVITVILETEHAVHFELIDETRAESSSRSIRISEVENAGEQEETVMPPGRGTGFIWRMNTYWRYLEADGGLYVEIDAVSLSRSLPPLIGAVIRPIIEDLPEQSLRTTLENVRKLLARQTAP